MPSELLFGPAIVCKFIVLSRSFVFRSWFDGLKDLSIAVETFGKARHVDAGNPTSGHGIQYSLNFLLDKRQRRLAVIHYL